MSREIELKIPLTNEEYSRIKSFLLEPSKIQGLSVANAEKILKSDEYFSLYKTHEERLKNKELRVIRIRSEKKQPLLPSGIDMYGEEVEKAYFCIKQKSIENGIEYNREHETFIENPAVLRAFFAAAGYIKWFEKKKDSISVTCTHSDNPSFEAHLELEKVNSLPYVEIEYTGDDFTADEVRQKLEKILLALKLDPKKRDSRSWAEILEK